MGPYCQYCARRCFVLRVLNSGRTILLATCDAGMRHDLNSCGQTHETAVNAATDPEAAAALVRVNTQQPAGDLSSQTVHAGAFKPRTWVGHGRPPAGLWWGFQHPGGDEERERIEVPCTLLPLPHGSLAVKFGDGTEWQVNGRRKFRLDLAANPAVQALRALRELERLCSVHRVPNCSQTSCRRTRRALGEVAGIRDADTLTPTGSSTR